MYLLVQIPRFRTWISLLLIYFVFFFSFSFSDHQTRKAGMMCSPKTPSKYDSASNFKSLMEKLSKRVEKDNWGTEDFEKKPEHFYGLGQCYGDLSNSDCSQCFSHSRKDLRRCLPTDKGRIYLDGCFLRFDNYNFFNESLDPEHDIVKCGCPTTDIDKDNIDKDAFSAKVERVISNVTEMAFNNQGFAVTGEKGGEGVEEGVYALAQCWMSVEKDDCMLCLNNARSELKKCAPGRGGTALYTGCFIRYSTESFYTMSSTDDDDHEDYYDDNDDDVDVDEVQVVRRTKVWPMIAVTAGAVFFAVLVVSVFVFRIGYNKLSKKTRADTLSLSSFSKLNFKYEVLEKATNNFNPSRKLGQGGSGSVFKGVLPDGRNIAVKRLFFNTRQWVDEFFNEVNLIGGIQHKNLVRLLGCSIEGPESLLVYEFIPNKSLDQILFLKDSAHILNWHQRFDITRGITEGLAFLHGGCGVKIIHRDIKSSNILLDEDLTPKIADFGLARCLASDKSHISTGIAGTLGYMAPEYLVRGQLNEKADVYAFGVVILEILCGRKNTVFTQGPSSVLHAVWKNYKAKQITESVDPVLSGCFPEREASKVLQIGLLCTQASVALRPSMSEVVQMLTNEDSVIPSPNQPPFLNASVLTPEDTTDGSTMNSIHPESDNPDPNGPSLSHASGEL